MVFQNLSDDLDPVLVNLFEKYRAGQTTEGETEQLFQSLAKMSNEKVENLLHGVWKQSGDSALVLDETVKERLIAQLQPAIEERTDQTRRFTIARILAAAALILVLGLGASYLFKKSDKQPADQPKLATSQPLLSPGGNKARLTLADGSTILLDSAVNGSLLSQGNVAINKADGRISYVAGDDRGPVVYNTIEIPRGGQYQLQLSDGTKIWLNSATTLRFPNRFEGNSRKVELSGEAYFDVASNPEKAFEVETGGTTVKVLGTAFNVNSYSDEATINTTVIEGSVMVTSKGNSRKLYPGEQSRVASNGSISMPDHVDIAQVVAWKDGKFAFGNTDLGTIMRQASRWYDADIVYQGTTRETFSGMLPRSENISKLLKIMEATDKVKFQIEGKKIIVKPN